eukprot:NODE_374_length_8570_cov_0.578208.p7 type:complete len:116 gc:universal NODE_374_length_8570_cov_0.578208:5736-6083(+)
MATKLFHGADPSKFQFGNLISNQIHFLKSRGVSLTFQWIRGHIGHEYNELSDQLAADSSFNSAIIHFYSKTKQQKPTMTRWTLNTTDIDFQNLDHQSKLQSISNIRNFIQIMHLH